MKVVKCIELLQNNLCSCFSESCPRTFILTHKLLKVVSAPDTPHLEAHRVSDQNIWLQSKILYRQHRNKGFYNVISRTLIVTETMI